MSKEIKPLPHSQESEMCAIGSVFCASTGPIVEEVCSILSAEHFYLPAHRVIWKAILVLVMEEEPIDIVTVKNQLVHTGQLDQAGGWEYLVNIAEVVPLARNGPAYANQVKDYWSLRQLVHGAKEILHSVIEDTELTVEEKLAKAESLMIAARTAKSAELSASNVVIGAKGRCIPWQLGLLGASNPAHVAKLGLTTGGLRLGQYTTIETPSGVGKSWTSQQTARDLLLAGYSVRIATLADMSASAIAERMISMRCGMTDRPEDEEDAAQYDAAVAEFRSWGDRLEFFDAGEDGNDTSVQSVCAWLNRKQAKLPCDVAIIDYAQQLTWKGRTSGKLEEQTLIAQYLGKWIAKHRNMALVVLSQVNEKGDTSWGTELLKAAAVRVQISREEVGEGQGERLKWTIAKHRFKSVTGWSGTWERTNFGVLFDENGVRM